MSALGRKRRTAFDEDAAMEFYRQGYSDSEIADSLRDGTGVNAVWRWRKYLGLPPNPQKYPTSPKAEPRDGMGWLRKIARENQQARDHGMNYGAWKAYSL